VPRIGAAPGAGPVSATLGDRSMRVLFVFAYLLFASFYAVLLFRMCGVGLDGFAESLLSTLGLPSASTGWPGQVMQSISPFALLGMVAARCRSIRSFLPLWWLVAALTVTWIPTAMRMLPAEWLPLGAYTALEWFENYAPVVCHSVCVTLCLQNRSDVQLSPNNALDRNRPAE
jgi:hypothetical protein